MKTLEYEDVLSVVGGYGKSQKRDILFILIPIAFIMAFIHMNIIFMISTPDHWCHEPEMERFNMTADERRTLLRPIVEVRGMKKPDRCHMHNLTDIIVISQTKDDLLQNMNKSVVILKQKCTNGWEYDKSNYKSTIITKWDLVCERSNMIPFIYAMSAFGTAVGTFVYNALSDRFGRKPVFFALLFGTIIGQAALVTVQNLTAFFVVKFLLGTTSPAAYQLPYLIILENVAPEMRARVNGLSSVIWTFGLMLKPLSAYLTADWTLFGWVSFVAVLPLLVLLKILPESNRWLITRKRYEEAADRLMLIGEINNRKASYEQLLQMVKTVGEKSVDSVNKNSAIRNLIKHRKTLLRLLIGCLIWTSIAMTYYGFHMNIANLNGNEFLNFFLLALVELPSHVAGWCLMQSRLGRRWSSVLFLLLITVACFTPVVSGSVGLVATVASLFGKFGAAAAFTTVYQLSAEMYPTSIRATCIGISSSVASIFGILTPHVIYASKYGRFLPYIILGSLCFITTIAATFLPETLNAYLPQTLEDSETFFSGQKYFSLAVRNVKKPNESKADALLKEEDSTTNV